jgi:hypothetical protein
MFFKTKDECTDLVSRLDGVRGLPAATPKANSDSQIKILFEHEPAHRMLVLARYVVSWLEPFDWCLLWATEWGVWGSGENWHLYYRLRQSYGDGKELIKAPGHFFLGHEAADLTTFLDIAIRFGWDCHVLTESDRLRCFVSHDGWMAITSPEPLDTIRQAVAGAEFKVK